MIASADDQSNFYLNFMSEPLDFAAAVLPQEALDGACEEGRILIANSIANWDLTSDIMALLVSVADSTVQVLQLANLSMFVEQFSFSSNISNDSGTERDGRYDTVWKRVLDCAMEAAADHFEKSCCAVSE